MKKNRVIVIGAGYGGLRAIEKLRHYPNLEITLIDKNPYHYLQTEAYGYVAGRFDLHDVALDIKNWALGFENQVRFIKERVTSISYNEKKVVTKNETYDYDYLIVATGARTNFFDFISGLKEHSVGIKNLDRAFEFRSIFEKLLYDKISRPKQNESKEINIAIGGAGLSGVEIAAEMAYVIQKHTKSIGESASDISINLIDAAPTILPGMDTYIIKHTTKRLESLGVKIMTNTFIEKIDESNIYFKSGTQLSYHFMVFTGGITANIIDSDKETEHSRMGQYITDEYLQVAPNAFAIGDCTELRDAKGDILPPTAQTAEKSAEYVASMIINKIENKKLKPFTTRIDGVFVALGGHYAVGVLFKVIKVKSNTAFLLKKLITKTYYIGLKLRLNIGFDKRTKEL